MKIGVIIEKDENGYYAFSPEMLSVSREAVSAIINARESITSEINGTTLIQSVPKFDCGELVESTEK